MSRRGGGMATLEQARSLVTLLENELLARASEADRMIGYYRGEQPLKFASAEFREYFANRYRERSEEHTSELQSRENLVCRRLLEKRKPAPGATNRGAS